MGALYWNGVKTATTWEFQIGKRTCSCIWSSFLHSRFVFRWNILKLVFIDRMTAAQNTIRNSELLVISLNTRLVHCQRTRGVSEYKQNCVALALKPRCNFWMTSCDKVYFLAQNCNFVKESRPDIVVETSTISIPSFDSNAYWQSSDRISNSFVSFPASPGGDLGSSRAIV